MASVAQATSSARNRNQSPAISQQSAERTIRKRKLSRPSPDQSILVDRAVLHDDHEVLRRIGDEVDVGQRVAIDKQQIGERALLHDTELARIGIALARQR